MRLHVICIKAHGVERALNEIYDGVIVNKKEGNAA
ncbi:Uncharacterised protein [Escherichia coli]|uniref:Uncharacterized protein n=1 Tax=Escherichia coli TaxID=562 RepID=A0A376ZI22_ECOLX|nr:Uncharacterised protein [Escherichia coli]